MTWSYIGDDPGLRLFTACYEAGAPMSFTPGMRVLEVGCCEGDWLHPAHAVWPDIDFVGIDWRAPDVVDGDGKVTRMKANGLDPDLFAPESFDAVVSISAIEHFGLGHYAKDPIDPDGDTHVVANIWRWLKPGGWFYVDVPYDPSGYRVNGTKCRIYDKHAVHERMGGPAGSWLPMWRGFVHAKAPGRLIDLRPTEPVQPFYYVAMVWRRV